MRSPRSPQRPMAFTGAEFLRGGVWAIGIFIVALPWVTFIGSSSFAGESATPGRTEFAIVPYVMLLAGAIAGFVYVTYGSALAYLLGRALRSTRRRSVHRVCFAALGLLIGYVTLMLTDLAGITMVSGSAGAGAPSMLSALISVAAGASVLAGWEITSAKALRADAWMLRDRDASTET